MASSVFCAGTGVASAPTNAIATQSLTRTVQRLPDISEDVVRGLAPDAEANEAVANRVAGPPRAPFGHRVNAAKTRGLPHDRQRAKKGFGTSTGPDIEAHDRPERPHLAAGGVVSRMRRKAGVMHGCDI